MLVLDKDNLIENKLFAPHIKKGKKLLIFHNKMIAYAKSSNEIDNESNFHSKMINFDDVFLDITTIMNSEYDKNKKNVALNIENENLKKQISDLQETQKSNDTIIENLKQKLKNEEQIAKKQDIVNVTLNKTIADLQTESLAKSAQDIKTKQTICDLNSKNTQLQKSNNELTLKLNEITFKVNEFTKINENLTTKNNEFTKLVNEYKVSLNQLNKDVTELKYNVKQKEKTNETLNKKICVLTESNCKIKKEISELKKKNKSNIGDLKKTHKKEISELKTKHRNELKKIKTTKTGASKGGKSKIKKKKKKKLLLSSDSDILSDPSPAFSSDDNGNYVPTSTNVNKKLSTKRQTRSQTNKLKKVTFNLQSNNSPKPGTQNSPQFTKNSTNSPKTIKNTPINPNQPLGSYELTLIFTNPSNFKTFNYMEYNLIDLQTHELEVNDLILHDSTYLVVNNEVCTIDELQHITTSTMHQLIKLPAKVVTTKMIENVINKKQKLRNNSNSASDKLPFLRTRTNEYFQNFLATFNHAIQIHSVIFKDGKLINVDPQIDHKKEFDELKKYDELFVPVSNKSSSDTISPPTQSENETHVIDTTISGNDNNNNSNNNNVIDAPKTKETINQSVINNDADTQRSNDKDLIQEPPFKKMKLTETHDISVNDGSLNKDSINEHSSDK